MLDIIAFFSNTLFFVLVTIALVSHVAQAKTVEASTILCAINSYLLIGLTASLLLLIIELFAPQSFNQITQETLNLIMFYHNHRRYYSGKRKGRTPMEILTGKKQEKDWITMLFDLAKEKDPSLLVQG